MLSILFGPLLSTRFLASSKDVKGSNFKWNHIVKLKYIQAFFKSQSWVILWII